MPWASLLLPWAFTLSDRKDAGKTDFQKLNGLSSCGKQTEGTKKFMPKKSEMPGVQTPQAIKLGSEDGKDYRQACKYGEDCYQKVL